ncbi:MAG: SDR family oxidoreductase [Elusimicrobia bacterium]|nr:SDR family oxidoreductase [Elusimicrobiota bacterium]
MAEPKPARALVLGAAGLVGHYCWRLLSKRPGWRVAGTYHKTPLAGLEKADLLDHAGTRAFIRDARPQLVIVAAANPFVDQCERLPQETRAVNVDATLAAASAAREAGATVVFFSSDYVFDGNGAPFGEGDPTAPLNEYGRQKVDAERGIAALGSDHLILRVSGVFGWELSRKNAVLQLVDRARSGRPVHAATDVRANPTYAANLPDVIAELWEGGRRGVYHAAGAEELTRFDFLSEAARAFALDPALVQKTTVASMHSPAKRPLHSSLRTDKVRSQVKAPLWGAARALAHMRAEEEAWTAYAAGLRPFASP